MHPSGVPSDGIAIEVGVLSGTKGVMARCPAAGVQVIVPHKFWNHSDQAETGLIWQTLDVIRVTGALPIHHVGSYMLFRSLKHASYTCRRNALPESQSDVAATSYAAWKLQV